MPCSDSSSNLYIKIDKEGHLISFDLSKLTCGCEVNTNTGFQQYCSNKKLEDMLEIKFENIASELGIESEEDKFMLYLEWDALRSAISQYLGCEREDVDKERCLITSVREEKDYIEIEEMILPPKDLPKIIPCHQKE